LVLTIVLLSYLFFRSIEEAECPKAEIIYSIIRVDRKEKVRLNLELQPGKRKKEK
jgi:hypothetical protein